MTSSHAPYDSAEDPVNGSAPSAMGKQPPWAVVLLCHGSQRGTTPQECSCAWESGQAGSRDGHENKNETPVWCRNCPSTPQGLQDAAGRLERELGPESARVVLSCLEFIQPHPDQAVRSLVEQGFRQVVLMPYLLGHGKHATLELDEVLADLKAQSPQAQLYMSQGLGADGRLADLVVERIQDLNHPDLNGPVPPAGQPVGRKNRPAGVLLVKAGTKTQYDDCQWMKDLGQMVENRLGPDYAVDVAQSHYGDPTMDAAAASLVESRQVSSITCVPYLFFPGLILQRNVLGGLARLEERYPEIPLAATPPLGVDDRLVSVAADRIREVWQRQAAPTK